MDPLNVVLIWEILTFSFEKGTPIFCYCYLEFFIFFVSTRMIFSRSRLDISVVKSGARVAVSSGTAPKVHCLASIVHQTGRVDTGEGEVDVALQWEQIDPVASQVP